MAGLAQLERQALNTVTAPETRSEASARLVSVDAFNTDHVECQWCSLHDLIHPAFSFLVGAALPFSIASRRRKGQSFRQMLGHAAWRALLLIVLGIFLR